MSVFARVFKLYLLIFVSALLSGCIGDNPSPTETPPQETLETGIQFLTVRFRDLENALPSVIDYEETSAEEFGLKLGVDGIYAIDSNIVFLFGSIGPPSGYGRSILLQSTDGGQHWEEVLTPQFGNSIFHVVFLADGTGWAVSAWRVEGISTFTVYQSTGYGETWGQIASIPNDRGIPYGLEFSDEMIGQFYVAWIIAGPNDQYITLATSDGGYTWEQTESVSLVDVEWDESGKQLISFEPHYERIDEMVKTPGGQIGSHWRPCIDTCVAFGSDESMWKIVEDREAEKLYVFRKLSTETSWQKVSIFPIRFAYLDGKITDWIP